jgi:single-strand DNA-binding protein
MFQQLMIVGNLGRNPEMRYTGDGKPVTNFSVAASRKYKSSAGELVEETLWIRVSVWGKQAETCNQFLKRGSKVLVVGRLVPDPATGSPRMFERTDGTQGTAFEMTADTVRFLSSKAEDDANGSGEGAEEKSESWENW